MKEAEGKDKTPRAEEEKKELSETPEEAEVEEPVEAAEEEAAEEIEEEGEGKEEKVTEKATAEVSAEAAKEKKEEAAEEKVEEAAVEEEKPETVEEEAKPEKEEREKEEEIVEERVYTIPLAKAWIGTPRKRSPRAMRIVRSFVWKHMKLGVRGEGEEEEEPKRLVIDNEVNERVWGRGGEKPPRKVRVRAAKDKEGNVTVYLAEGD
jgi:large subunit ribosomal protein L31e